MLKRAYHQEALLNAFQGDLRLGSNVLQEASGLKRPVMFPALSWLIINDYVERITKDGYQLTSTGRAALENGDNLYLDTPDLKTKPKPLKNTFTLRIWRAMAVKPIFTLRDLVAVASPENEKDPMGSASRLILALERVGYLRRRAVRERGTTPCSNGYLRYQRIKHTGLYCPIVRPGTKQVFDPNTGETMSWG